MASENAKTFMKYFLFAFVFIVSFCLIKIQKLETLGLGLFFIANILFCIFVGKTLLDGSISPEGKDTEWWMRYGTMVVALAFSLVSSIMMIMTIVTLHNKFADNQSGIEWSPTSRKHLDDAETIFITITTFIGVISLYVYNSPEQVRKFVYTIFDTILNGDAANWLRALFPVVILSIGSALYGRLEMPLLEVSKKPTSVICDPKNNPGIQKFKDSFVKTYWFLFAFMMVILARPFVEANFNVLGLSPSMLIGFPQNDRSLIFGQNPSVSLLSVLTLGLSNLMGWNKQLSDKLKSNSDISSNRITIGLIQLGVVIVFIMFIVLLFILIFAQVKNAPAMYSSVIFSGIRVILVIASYFILSTEPYSNIAMAKPYLNAINSLLLMPVFRWDLLYLGAKYAFGIVALVYASFTIRDFQEIPKTNPCLFKDAHILQLYIAFITFLIIFYVFNTLSASNLTLLVTTIMRYLVPPSLLGLSSYLIYVTDYLMKLSPQLIVQ